MYFIPWESEIHTSVNNVCIFNFPLYRTMFLTGTLQIVYFQSVNVNALLKAFFVKISKLFGLFLKEPMSI